MADQRFHIAEWYGRPFHKLTDAERLARAEHKGKGAAMTKPEIARLEFLRGKAKTVELKSGEEKRLGVLESKLRRQQLERMECPFKFGISYPICTKDGGVCSLRLFEVGVENAEPVSGEVGRIRATCPHRFHQNGTIFEEIGRQILDDPNPSVAVEVGFLESTGTLDSEAGEDVGRIDMILVKNSTNAAIPMDWVAVEIQAVYFSGKEMRREFKELASNAGALKLPVEKRRPDYRSSGVKRLMPQLQTKVPTLRRWGKKMVVVVDAPFFESMGRMRPVDEVSNADIVWMLVDFVEQPSSEPCRLTVVKSVFTTLESATEGLTGGLPVSKGEFEDRIRAKLGS